MNNKYSLHVLHDYCISREYSLNICDSENYLFHNFLILNTKYISRILNPYFLIKIASKL